MSNFYKFTVIPIIYLIIGTYLLSVAFMEPLIGVSIAKKDKQWVVEKIESQSWADKNDIDIGDQIVAVNGLAIEKQKKIIRNQFIPSATSISNVKDGTIQTIQVLHKDLMRQFLFHVIFPTLYFLLTIVSILHFEKTIKFNSSKFVFVNFLISVSFAYISASASSKYDLIGILVNSSCIVISLILFIRFLDYYLQLDINGVYLKSLYILPLIVGIFDIISHFHPRFYPLTTLLLFIFISLLGCIIIMCIVKSYIQKRKKNKIKYIICTLLFPMIPFVFLYSIPMLVIGEEILSAEVSGLFLLIIPFSVLFIGLSEKLFDLHYFISRFQYYSLLAGIFSVLFTVTLLLMLKVSLQQSIIALILMFLSVFTFLFLKEYIDFRSRKNLFTKKGDKIHNVYTSIIKMSQVMDQEHLLAILKTEIQESLSIQSIEFEKRMYFARKKCIKVQSFLHSQSPMKISSYFVRDRAFVKR